MRLSFKEDIIITARPSDLLENTCVVKNNNNNNNNRWLSKMIHRRTFHVDNCSI